MPKNFETPPPEPEHPTLCYLKNPKPPFAMFRCTLPKGHSGPHSWEQ